MLECMHSAKVLTEQTSKNQKVNMDCIQQKFTEYQIPVTGFKESLNTFNGEASKHTAYVIQR